MKKVEYIDVGNMTDQEAKRTMLRLRGWSDAEIRSNERLDLILNMCIGLAIFSCGAVSVIEIFV